MKREDEAFALISLYIIIYKGTSGQIYKSLFCQRPTISLSISMSSILLAQDIQTLAHDTLQFQF